MRADELARMDSTRWDAFLSTFRRYSTETTKACVNAPPEAVHVAQGAARQCTALLELLENSVKVADQIRNGRTTK